MAEIKFIKGNIFTTNCQTIVNTINCVGVMGAGIALEFRYRYPKMFEQYQNLCKEKHIKIGSLWLYSKEESRKWVLNFPTKYDWKQDSKIEYLEKGLQKFIETYHIKGIKSIAFPLLGADKGGIDPDVSKEIMRKYLSKCEIPIEIYQFDPYAQDDLISNAYNIFTKEKPNIASRITGIEIKTINKIRKVLESSNVHSINELGKAKGIGESTLQMCYDALIKLQGKHTHNITDLDLFSAPPKLINSEQFESVPQTHFIKRDKKEKLAQLPFSEKVALTGLDLNVLLDIENHKDNVKIKDFIIYCERLHINPSSLLKLFQDNLAVSL